MLWQGCASGPGLGIWNHMTHDTKPEPTPLLILGIIHARQWAVPGPASLSIEQND